MRIAATPRLCYHDGHIHVSGKHIKLSRSEIVVGSAPLPGQHTEEILTSLLHCSPEEVRKLEAEGAVYCSPGPATASS